MKVKDFLMEKSEYTVAKNPNDGKWYVLGSTGKGKSGKTYYMPVSTGFKSKGEADKWAKKQPLADREAKGLIPESVLLTEIGNKEYEVARGPVDKLWYVLRRDKGNKKQYRPVASGFKDKKQAVASMKKLMGESTVIQEIKSIVISKLKHKGANYELKREFRWDAPRTILTYVVYKNGHEIGQEDPSLKSEVIIKRFEKNVKSGDYHTRTYKVKGRR